jgi:hypothetical protein
MYNNLHKTSITKTKKGRAAVGAPSERFDPDIQEINDVASGSESEEEDVTEV